MISATYEVFHPERILSTSNAPRLLEWVSNCLETGNKRLLIDLRYVSFMDSSGLGALVTALKRVREANGKLVLCSLGGQAKMLFEIAGMDNVFEIYPSQESFVQTLNNPVNEKDSKA